MNDGIEDDEAPWDPDAPVELPIDGELDLHTFRPKDVPDLLDAYLPACQEKGILDVRIIHGKGTGALGRRVRAILERHPLVESYRIADVTAGGWGATWARLRPRGEHGDLP